MKCSQSPLVKRRIRNLQVSRLVTAVLTMRAYLTDLLFAVISCVSVISLRHCPEPHFASLCTEQAGGDGCEGRRFQGVRGVAGQLPAVKRSM